jgi:beta-phosphoglucomutase-like phosphatase (HAD superfamily)
VTHTLAAIGLADRIGVITRSEAVPRGKPFPDVFLLAAQELGVAPETCLAFEDAPVGVTAARRAGMRCAAITSTFSAETLAASELPPDAAYRDFDDYLETDGRWLA